MLRLWVIVMLLLLGPSGPGQAAQRIPPGEPLYPELEILVDPTRTLTFEDVQTRSDFEKRSPIVGFNPEHLWVRMEIENPGPDHLSIIMEDQWALTDHIAIHHRLPDGRVQLHVRGHKEPAWPGQRLHRYPYVALNLDPGVHTFYVQYRTNDIVGSRLALWHAEDFSMHQLLTQLAYGFLVGAMLVMSIYNFFLYLVMRIASYLYYSMYSFVFVVFHWCFSGYFSQLTGLYEWWIDEGTIGFGASAILGVVLFTRNFLQLGKYSKFLDRAGWLPFSLGSLAIVCTFIDFQMSALAIICANLSIASWIVMCSFYSTYKKVPEGRVFLMAWTFFVIGDVGTILYYVGLAQPNVVTQWGMIVGSVTELVFLSFGLANSVNRIRQEASETREKLNMELSQNLSRVEAQVQSKTRDIRLILQNIQQGIFTIQGDRLVIQDEHSAALLPMLGEGAVSGRSLTEIFLQKLDIDADQRSQIESALVSMQSEDPLSFELNAHVLPRETKLIRALDDKRILELNWEPMLNEASKIERILVTLRDVTMDRELQARSRDQSEEIMTISTILQGDPRLFGMFLKSSRVSLLRAFEIIQRMGSGKDQTSELHRILHTLKGNARTEKLQNLARIIHECEDKIQHGALRREDLSAIESELRRYHRTFDRYFATHFNLEAVSISRDELVALHEVLKKQGLEKQASLVRGWLQKSLFSLSQLQSRLKADIPGLAAELGKEPCMLHCSFENAYVSHEVFEALTDICGHLLRNSFDHGLESAAERIQAGKTPYGHIQVNFVSGAEPCIIWRDDGRGLDLGAIVAKAQKREPDRDLSMTLVNEELCLTLLTASGFTTRDAASLISGRGVGLDAVDHRLKHIDGRLQLRFVGPRADDRFQKFELVLWLPKQSLRATGTLVGLPQAS